MMHKSSSRQAISVAENSPSIEDSNRENSNIAASSVIVSASSTNRNSNMYGNEDVSAYTTTKDKLNIDTAQVLNMELLVKCQDQDKDDGTDVTVASLSDKSALEKLATVLEVEDQDVRQLPQKKPMVCGHRGAVYKSLENTRHSVRMAHEIGCPEVEVDVFLLKCGTLCLFHGYGNYEDPGRFENYSSNMDGRILDYTYDELRMKYMFNPYFDEFICGPDIIRAMEKEGECYIPTLEEVLIDVKKYGMVINIELKGPNTALPTVELVEKLDMVDQVKFGSFDLSQIQTVRELRPQRCAETGKYIYKTAALFEFVVPDDFVQIALDLKASEINLCYSTCTKSRVDAIHAAGLDSICWFRGAIGMKEDVATRFDDVGNEDEKMFRIVMATGVRKMCTNKPGVLMQILKQ